MLPTNPIRRAILLALTTLSGILCSHRINPVAAADIPGADRFKPPERNEKFRALPRPFSYDMPLVSSAGEKAVIVYGKNAEWTRTAAGKVRDFIKVWSGVELAVADDLTVTSEETWLIAEAYRKTPLIVLGNCRDNRVLHALGTRYLAYSNHTWPGGDRFTIRTVFEPFIADVNHLALEASTPEGLDGAVARFEQLLKSLPGGGAATIPHTMLTGGTKDQWLPPGDWSWQPTPGYVDLSKSVTEIAAATKDKSLPGNLGHGAMGACMGGVFSAKEPHVSGGAEAAKAIAAKLMNDSRAWGHRLHQPYDHYGAMERILAMRCVMACGVLTPEEFNEAENWMVLSAADPQEYYYNEIGAYDHRMNHDGGRHFCAILFFSLQLLDYVANHCNLDETTRKEVERRLDGARKTTAEYVRSFRDNMDTWELGECTMLLLYSMLHQGMPQAIKNGNLRRMADIYAMTTDNLINPNVWRIYGSYAGLDDYLCAAPGLVKTNWHGRGLLPAAMFYYDDPQDRWWVKNLGYPTGVLSSVAAPMFPMHFDQQGEAATPTRYSGVVAMPFDPRLYDVIAKPESGGGWGRRFPVRLPGPLEKSVDRVVFRDGMDPNDAYLFLATTQRFHDIMVGQSNAIARYTDLGDVWLFHNTMLFTSWARNVVSISNGKPFVPATGCTLEAISNLGDVSAVAAKENGVGGADWTRNIVHWRGHYFVVLDKVKALDNDSFNLVCRWRTPNPARLSGNVWTVSASSGNTMRLQNGESLRQTSEYRECDGAARPYVLSQHKSVRLAKDEAVTFQNLLYVAGEKRRDAFELRRVSANVVMVKGTADGRPHLALIGIEAKLPLPGIETDTAIYHAAGTRLLLAGVTTVKAVSGKSGRSNGRTALFSASQPVNLLLDSATGEGEVEVTGTGKVEVRLGSGTTVEAAPGKTSIKVANAPVLPRLPGLLRQLWATTSPSGEPPQSAIANPQSESPFRQVVAADSLQRPVSRVVRLKLSSTPPTQQPLDYTAENQYTAWLAGYYRTWYQRDGIELKIELEQPTRLSCLRLVSTMDAPRGKKLYDAGDLKFSLVLSNDDFKADSRRVDSPTVTFEETDIYPIFHHDFGRLPTFRIAVNDTAKYIKVLPVAVNPAKQFVTIQGVEVYGVERAEDLNVKAFAADLNGDGSCELVVGTSDKQVAAYHETGRRLWERTVPGDIFTMNCADLDEDGKSEALVYTTMETLHCINGDGSERYRADVCDAVRKQLGQEHLDNNSAAGGALAMGVWGPDDPKKKEVLLPSEVSYRVTADGQPHVWEMYRDWGWRAATELKNLFPNEPTVIATSGWCVAQFSSRKDKDGGYTRVGYKPAAGVPGAPLMHWFGWVKGLDLPGYKGVLAANESGCNWCTVESLLSEDPAKQGNSWGFYTGGVPIVAALAEDLTGDGLPDVLIAREDGFVNVLSLDGGKQIALLNTGETILGMALLAAADGKPRLAVGTRFGVHLFGRDFQKLGFTPAPSVAFAGPGGKKQDRVYCVDASGGTRVLILR